jgi:hypothetical protein
MTGVIAAARESIAAAAAVPVGSVEPHELGETLAQLTTLQAQVASLRLEVLAEADRRRVAEESADTGTDAWAARLTGTTRGVMAGGLWLARMLQERYAATRVAFAAGRISEDQVRVIVRAAERLAAQVTDQQRADAEQVLVDKACAGVNPRRLRQAGRRMAERISKQLADEHEADQLEEEEQRAELETWLALHDNGDGTFSGRFIIPELHGHLLRTALERLCAPRRLTRSKDGQPMVDETVPEQSATPSWSERLGSAFVELLEHLPTEGHGPVGATLLLTLDYTHLLDGLASAGLDTGARISTGEARRLACGAGIVPAVLGGPSEPLDVGRERRLHTQAMRRALALRHDTCAADGCERPFAWCEIHHPHAWSDGGRTSAANAVPLCGHHHRRVHDRRFRHRYRPDGSVRFTRRT